MIKELLFMKNGKVSIAPMISIIFAFAAIGLAFQAFTTNVLDALRIGVIAIFAVIAVAPQTIGKVASKYNPPNAG